MLFHVKRFQFKKHGAVLQSVVLFNWQEANRAKAQEVDDE